jgi:hypothetical protein
MATTVPHRVHYAEEYAHRKGLITGLIVGVLGGGIIGGIIGTSIVESGRAPVLGVASPEGETGRNRIMGTTERPADEQFPPRNAQQP